MTEAAPVDIPSTEFRDALTGAALGAADVSMVFAWKTDRLRITWPAVSIEASRQDVERLKTAIDGAGLCKADVYPHLKFLSVAFGPTVHVIYAIASEPMP